MWFSRFRTRWRELEERVGQVVAINRRNLNYIYPHNPRQFFPLADNKILNKENMKKAGVPIPETYKVFSYFFELRNLREDLAPFPEFVIKPALGRAGGGIIVIVGRDGDDWVGISGRKYGIDELRSHLGDIIFGVHSFEQTDQAMIEERIIQHPDLDAIGGLGLSDIRVILFQDKPVISMLRIPTKAAGGRSNLHQGAVGVGVDLETGRTNHAIQAGLPITTHPDTGSELLGREIPLWKEVMEISQKAARAVPLKYLGVDIAITSNSPVLLEINARPGLEIQNANLKGMADILASIEILA